MAQHTHSKYMYILLFAPCKLRCWQVMHHKMDAMEVRHSLGPIPRLESPPPKERHTRFGITLRPYLRSRAISRERACVTCHIHTSLCIIWHHIISFTIWRPNSHMISYVHHTTSCALAVLYAIVWYTSSCMHVYATYREWMRITINDICILHSLNESVWYIFLNELLCTVDCAGRHTHNVYVIKIAFYGTCP